MSKLGLSLWVRDGSSYNKSINVINHTYGLEDKEPHMIILIETAKIFVKNLHTFMIKVLENLD